MTIGHGTATDVVYGYEPLWGELRLRPARAEPDGDSLLVTGTNSRCADNSLSARVVV